MDWNRLGVGQVDYGVAGDELLGDERDALADPHGRSFLDERLGGVVLVADRHNEGCIIRWLAEFAVGTPLGAGVVEAE